MLPELQSAIKHPINQLQTMIFISRAFKRGGVPKINNHTAAWKGMLRKINKSYLFGQIMICSEEMGFVPTNEYFVRANRDLF